MADISKITLPGGTVYNIKDATARTQIQNIQTTITGAMYYAGITTTEITDGATTANITIDGTSMTFGSNEAGAVVIYGEKEYIWNGSKWQEFGSTGSLKALAFKDSASAIYTPSGTVGQPVFTGVNKEVSVSGVPTGNVAIGIGSGTANYTPEGSISVTPNIELNTTTVNSITSVGTLPTCQLPQLSTTVSDEVLTLAWAAGSFDQGSLPTKQDNINVATSVRAATASGTFTGTGAEIIGSFTGSSFTSTGMYEPEGQVTQPTFTGTEATITVT